MKLQIVAYTESAGDVTVMEYVIPDTTSNWERILRKMDAYVWRHCNQEDVIELFCIMTDKTSHHDMTQAWAHEYMMYYPNHDLPFI